MSAADRPTVRLEDVQAAARRLEGHIRRTPTLRTSVPTPQGTREVVLKLEQTQLSGTFKARGILNAALHAAEEEILTAGGLVIASGGNAGIAAAVAGTVVGAKVTVSVPHDAPRAKLERLEELGAEIIGGHRDHAASNTWADIFAAEHDALRLHAYDLPDVVAGAGTLLLEALEQEPRLGSVVVSVGGGGLVAGTAVTAGGAGVRTVAVEPEGAPTLHAALSAGGIVPVEVDTIAQDSLGAERLGHLAWKACRDAELTSVLVTDKQIVAARRLLWQETRLLVENAAACALAALTSGAWVPPEGEVPMVVLCGANVDVPV